MVEDRQMRLLFSGCMETTLSRRLEGPRENHAEVRFHRVHHESFSWFTATPP